MEGPWSGDRKPDRSGGRGGRSDSGGRGGRSDSGGRGGRSILAAVEVAQTMGRGSRSGSHDRGRDRRWHEASRTL